MKGVLKMKKSSYIQGAAVITAACVVLLSGCTYRLTDEDWAKNGKVRLSLNWPDGERPSGGMTYYFYKDGAARPVIRQGEAWGYEGTLPAGDYEVVACAADGKSILLDMENGYDAAFGIARRASELKSADIEVVQPRFLYGTGDALAHVAGFRAVTKELYPANLVRTLELNIKITGGGEEQVENLTGLLTGVASGIYIPTGKLLFDTPASVSFDTKPDATGVYTSSLNLFGVSGGAAGGYKDVDVYLTLERSGEPEITSFTNITGEINEAFDATLSVHIVLDLEIAFDAVNGMTVTASGWREGTGQVDASGI